MDAYSSHSDFLRAISHPTRIAVLDILRDGEQCVCHMEAMIGLRQASISQQLMILREAGIVAVRRDGLNIYYRVTKPQVFQILDAVDAAIGKHQPLVMHKHGKSECPCPKCNSVQAIPLGEINVRG